MNNKLQHLLLMTLVSVSLTATGAPPERPEDILPVGIVKLSDHPESRSRTWTGIGRLRGENTAFCTASLIDTRNTPLATATTPAYVITSHRCLNTKNYGEYTYAGGTRHNTSMQGTLFFNNFDNTLGDVKSYEFKRVAWQSDGGLNLAIIELDTTLSELMAKGIQPLKIAQRTPPTGTEILTLGIPEFSNLHAMHCTQLAPVDVASYPWVGAKVLGNQCADLTHGGLGGPVLSKFSNELISLVVANNHGANPDNKCLANAPCELRANTAHWRPDTHYTQPVSFLNQCFVEGKLAADTPACDLYKLTSVAVEPARQPPARVFEKGLTEKETGPDTFDVGVTVDSPLYRYKYTHDAKACRDGSHYSQAMSAKDATINFTLNNQVGLHMLCIVGVESHEDRLTSAQFDAAKIITVERIEIQPQVPSLQIDRYRHYREQYVAHWNHNIPLLDHYKIKFGPYESTDCKTPEGYAELLDYEERPRDSGPWESIYPHKDHPTDASLILIKQTKEQLIDGYYSKIISSGENALTLCTVSYNLKKEPSQPRMDILRPL